jgi:23S rRNA-/tRNA-specific pseudouridylate synthase
MKTTQIRLHKFLIDWLKSNSPAAYTIPEIKRNIVAHGVFVSGVLTHSQLEWVYPSQTVALNNWPSREPGDLTKIKVVYEDADCLVINKPVGLVVEPGAGHPYDNVVSWLLENYPEQDFKKLHGEDSFEIIDESEKYYDDKDEISIFNIRSWAAMTHQKPKKPASNAHIVVGKMNREHQYNMYLRQEKIQSRPYTFGALAGGKVEMENKDYKKLIPVSGLVHRLDKDTQGLLLVAKNLESFHKLQDQFRSRNVVKKYLAVVDGIVDQQIHLGNWQARSLSNPIEQKFFWTESDAFGYSKDARHAESIIEPLFVCKESNQSIIQVQIKTGRMHQIRIQCLALGFPLTNDKAYNLKDQAKEIGSSVKLPLDKGLSRSDWGFKSDTTTSTKIQSNATHNGDEVFASTNQSNLSHSGTGSFVTLKMTALNLPKQFHANPNNATTEPTKPTPELKPKDFQAKQKTLFGEGDYCLLSNHLEIVLPSGKLTKFVVNEI